VWNKRGSPVWPAADDLDAMERAQAPVLMLSSPKKDPDLAAATTTVSVRLPSVTLMQFCTPPQGSLPAPEQLTLFAVPKFGGTVVYWRRPSPDTILETLRSFVVEYSTSGMDGPFKVATNATVLSTSFCHRHSDSVESSKRCYRVRALDYWSRYSEQSPVACGVATANEQ